MMETSRSHRTVLRSVPMKITCFIFGVFVGLSIKDSATWISTFPVFETASKCRSSSDDNTESALNSSYEIALSNDSRTKVVPSACPCISNYLTTLKRLGIHNGNITFNEWEQALCRPRPPPEKISFKPLILGVGPGTTATRSFALAVSLLGEDVLHYAVVRKGNGQNVWEWDQQKTKSGSGGVLNHSGSNEKVPTHKYFQMRKLIDGMGDSRERWDDAMNIDFADLFKPINAVFDSPYAMYALDILRFHPLAKVIMTHRDPWTWYEKRTEFCSGPRKPRWCSVPYLLRPFNLTMKHVDWTRDQIVGSFVATEEAIQCMVAKGQYLRVDAWNPPTRNVVTNSTTNKTNEEGWMQAIARFIGVEVPPPESGCSVPWHASHNLECVGNDTACKNCAEFKRKHSQ